MHRFLDDNPIGLLENSIVFENRTKRKQKEILKKRFSAKTVFKKLACFSQVF